APFPKTFGVGSLHRLSLENRRREQAPGWSKCCPKDTKGNAGDWFGRSHWWRQCRRVRHSLYGAGGREPFVPVLEGPHTNIREKIRRSGRRPYRICPKNTLGAGVPPCVWC